MITVVIMKYSVATHPWFQGNNLSHYISCL